MKSKWEQYKEKVGSTRPWDMLNPNIEHVDKNVQAYRYNICKACPEFVSLTTQCRQCGCVMAMKTKLPGATCPLGKW